MEYKKLPPTEVLWEYFIYAPLTGKLYWRKSPGGGVRKGDEISSKEKYNKVSLHGSSFKVHRLIWKFMTCKDPGIWLVDHRHDVINGVYKSNQWWNLRLANKSQNRACRH